MRRIVARGVGLLALAGLVACWALPAERLLDAPQRSVTRKAARMSRNLAERHGLFCLLTFDEPQVRDWISGATALAPGTVSVPGRYGQGRKFDGREQTFIELPIRWWKCGTSFTIACWVKIDGRAHTQDILCNYGVGGQAGFRLRDGAMTFDLPAGTRQSVAYPFKRYGEFVHLAAVVDLPHGRMSLYENGRCLAQGPLSTIDWPPMNMIIGKPVWYESRHPFRGVIDDLAIWIRPLAPAEVAACATSPAGLLRTLTGSVRYAAWRLAQGWAAALRSAAGVADCLPPLSRSRNGGIAQLPEVRLIMTGGDRRHFVAAHRRSRASGRRTDAAAAPRRVYAAHDGAVVPARICLTGTDTSYADADRPGYLIETEEGATRLLGLRRLFLAPPESCGLLAPLADAALRSSLGLPVPSNGLCRLTINNVFRGVYFFSDYAFSGVLPGEFPDVYDIQPRHPILWFTGFRPDTSAWPARTAFRAPWPLLPAEVAARYDDVARRYAGALCADAQSPLSRKERKLMLRRERASVAASWPSAPEAWSAARRAAAFLDEFMVLGSNASPFRLVSPLALDAVRLPGVKLTWRSSNPAVLRADGSLARPAAGGPVAVELTARLDDARDVQEKTFRFRVMPAVIAVPTLLLYVDQPLSKTRRVDAVAAICEAGEDAPSRILPAQQGSRGGINYRGNSSFWYNKKLFALRTDEPHRLLGDAFQRILLAVNSKQDPTFARNRLAYDLFRDFAREGAPRFAPAICPAEVFVNGRYWGLHELCMRVDESLLGATNAPAQREDGRFVFYRNEKIRPRSPPMRAARPAPRKGSFLEPYLELERFMKQPASAAWAAEVERRLDIGNVIDMQILLNLTQNLNGRPFDYLAHEILVYEGGPASTFFHVPWDFELTFQTGWQWMANDMMRRLESDCPGYRERLAARWRELRAGILTPEALNARIDALTGPLAGYAEWDHQQWDYVGMESSYARLVENLEAAVRANLAAMEAHFAANPPEP